MGNRAFLTVFIPVDELRSPEKEFYEKFHAYKQGEVDFKEVKALADVAFGNNPTYQDYQVYSFIADDTLPRGEFRIINDRLYVKPDEYVTSYRLVELESRILIPKWLLLFDGIKSISYCVFQRVLKEILDLGYNDYPMNFDMYPPSSILELNYSELTFDTKI